MLNGILDIDVLKVLLKESSVAIMVGVTLAIVNAIRLYIMYPGRSDKMMLSVVVGLTLIITAILAKGLGCLLPMLAKKLKMDPAYMASPLITTIVDACSIMIYFTIAVALMHIAV